MCNGMPGLSERGTAARRRWQGQTVRAAIWKTPDDGPVMARRINLDGDGQADKMGRSGSVSPTKGPRGSSSMQLGRCGVIARSRSALLLCTRKRPSRSLAVGRPLRTRTKRLLARDRFPSRSCIGGRATARPLPPLSMRLDTLVIMRRGRSRATAFGLDPVAARNAPRAPSQDDGRGLRRPPADARSGRRVGALGREF
jgi:hypothetical protein